MQQHKAYDKEMALKNENPTMDNFIIPNDVCNLAYKITKKNVAKAQGSSNGCKYVGLGKSFLCLFNSNEYEL
jgi:hypothetical protein